MSNFFTTGISGLLAFQRALDTTSHNIANVDTPGYSRQRTEFMTRPADPAGNGWVGNGVEVSTIRRMYDDVLALQVRTASSSYGRADAFSSQLERVNNLFANTSTGFSVTLQRFANALQDVANAPASIAARQVLLSEANGLAERLRSYESQLASFGAQVEAQIRSEASEVSQIAASLAQLNAEIATASTRTGQPPNDLLDQRDRLLDDLSSRIEVSTVLQDDGQLNVFIGSGQPLVVGSNAAELVPVTDPFERSRQAVALRLPGGAPVDVTAMLSGGTLGGLLEFRSQVLEPTRNELGRIAVALAESFNAQHHAGMDLTGALGLDFFTVGGVATYPHATNAGNATLSVTRADIGALTDGDYLLQRTGGGWSLHRTDTGATITLGGTGTAADPFTADGLEIVVNGTVQDGDRFLIRPTSAAVSGLTVAVTDPARLAAAAPIRTAANPANAGNAQISAGEVIDASDPALRSTVTIEFLSPTTYSVNGAGTLTYTSGSPITINGWSVEITGTPDAGDRFTVSDNSGGAGDNRNALALVQSLYSPVLENGTVSMNDASTRLVGSIGVATRHAQGSRDAQEVVQREARDARDGLSGVNLDEEAANLMRYQQAYQAMAQLIRIGSTLFESLLAATSRS